MKAFEIHVFQSVCLSMSNAVEKDPGRSAIHLKNEHDFLTNSMLVEKVQFVCAFIFDSNIQEKTEHN